MERKIYWQPELPLAIIYWSTTFIFLFFGFILALEKASIHWKSYLAFACFFFFVWLSRRRFIRFSASSLEISYVRFWKNEVIPYVEIEQFCWEENHLLIHYQQRVFDGCFIGKQKIRCQAMIAKAANWKEIGE
ncbi:EbsA family protein [Enterococcus sp. LJL98]